VASLPPKYRAVAKFIPVPEPEVMPAATILPSSPMATLRASSLTPKKSVITLPSWPNVVLRLPSGL
jgi:hypothetical protein